MESFYAPMILFLTLFLFSFNFVFVCVHKKFKIDEVHHGLYFTQVVKS